MTNQPCIQDWFIAALMHDLGKTRDWGHHADWSGMPYAQTQTLKNMAGLASKHHEDVFSSSALDEITLLKLADRMQKGLYAHPYARDFENSRNPPPEIAKPTKQLLDAPVFQPYFGNSETWNESRRAQLESEILAFLKNAPTLENFLRLQREKLDAFPHTTYIPHLALGLHQQITAVLFFFLHRYARRNTLIQASQLAGFTLHAVTITPKPLAFFARLRYLDAYRQAAEKLRAYLFEKIFQPIQSEGLVFTEQANPFQFFDGTSLAVLCDNDQDIADTLQSFLNQSDTLLDSINAQIHSYRLLKFGETKSKTLFVGASNIERTVRDITIVPTRATRFTAQTETRCQHCGAATPAIELTTIGAKNLCVTCAQVERQQGMVDLKKFCPEGYLGWVFLAFESPLLDAALEQAQIINDEVAAQMMIPPGYLTPSATGFDEYFQALTHIQAFQAKCDEQIKTLGNGVKRLAHFTHLAIYLLCEDNYWKFLAFLNQERKQLRIPTTLRAFLCNAHYPVWSLMERGAEFDSKKRDLYYHIAQGRVTMFTDENVTTIRNLSTLARSERVPLTQLNGLVRTALQTSKQELFLEIDARAHARPSKIGQRFPGQLKNGLDALKASDDFGEREQRAIFIKYVAKLRGED